MGLFDTDTSKDHKGSITTHLALQKDPPEFRSGKNGFANELTREELDRVLFIIKTCGEKDPELMTILDKLEERKVQRGFA